MKKEIWQACELDPRAQVVLHKDYLKMKNAKKESEAAKVLPEVEPCPFCGNTPELRQGLYVICWTPKCAMYSNGVSPSKWNKRAEPTMVQFDYSPIKKSEES